MLIFTDPGWWWWRTKDEGHCVWLYQENLWCDVCVGLLLALDQNCGGNHQLQTKYFNHLLPGPVHHRVWPLHRALHHLVHRGQCLVHECRPLWCGVWWNVSILITWLIFSWWCWCQTIRNNLISLSRSPFFNSMLTNGNYFFTAIFAVESFVKLFAMSPRYFFAVNN